MATTAVGVAVLVGWALDLPTLKSVLPGVVSMKANTALGFVLAGLSLSLRERGRASRITTGALAGATALLGFLTLVEYALGVNLGIDQFLFREAAGTVGTLSPGRMAPTTAVSFLLVGLSRWLAIWPSTVAVAQGLALVVALLGYLSLTGYVLGATALIGIGRFTQMAVHTAALFLLAGLGLIVLRPTEGFARVIGSATAAGWMLRRLLPTLFIVPVLIGWLGAWGVRSGHWNGPFAVSLVVVLLAVVLAGLTYTFAHALIRIEGDRLRTEAALHRTRSILQAAMDQSPAGIAIAEAPSGNLSYVNDAGLPVHGNSPLLDLDGTPLPADAVPLARAIQHGETSSREFIVRRSPSDDRLVLARAAPVLDQQGKVTAAVVVSVDITDRKRSEEALRRSEVHFRQLVSALPIPVAFYNGRGDVVTLNERFTRLLGYTLEDIPTVDEWFRKAYPDEHYRDQVAKAWAGRVRDVAGRGVETPAGEVRVTCKSGEVRTLAISGVTIGQDLLVTMIDVTEARTLQEQLSLAARLAAMGTLVAGVAHEINNPLSGALAGQTAAREIVREFRQAIQRGAAPEPVSSAAALGEALEALDDAQEGGRRVARIVKDLAMFGRPDAARSRIRLADVVSAARQWFPPDVARRADVKVEDDGAAEVVAAAGQIEQVVVNLVANAAGATPDGERGVITIRLGPG
ncbi:MAG: PAS domain S-box protein, partial [Deltaproteobacteria bacterium]